MTEFLRKIINALRLPQSSMIELVLKIIDAPRAPSDIYAQAFSLNN